MNVIYQPQAPYQHALKRQEYEQASAKKRSVFVLVWTQAWRVDA